MAVYFFELYVFKLKKYHIRQIVSCIIDCYARHQIILGLFGDVRNEAVIQPRAEQGFGVLANITQYLPALVFVVTIGADRISGTFKLILLPSSVDFVIIPV